MNKEKSLEQFKKSINLMFENNDKEIYLHKDDALKIEYYIYSLEQQVKKQKEVIDRLNFIKNRKNQGASQENINKMAIEFVNSYLKEVSEWK